MRPIVQPEHPRRANLVRAKTLRRKGEGAKDTKDIDSGILTVAFVALNEITYWLVACPYSHRAVDDFAI